MRKLMTLAALISVVALAGTAYANLDAFSIKKVEILVEETVGFVGSSDGAFTTESGVIETEAFAITVPYDVHANTQYVNMAVCATDMFKADVPTSPYVIPLAGTPVVISGTGFTPSALPMPFTAFDLPETPAGDAYEWLFDCTDMAMFHSSDNGSFSWPVDVTVDWDQGDFELPTGDYSGYVKLTVYVVP